MNAAQRAAKRHKRENRDNKGVSTEAKRHAYNAAVRSARARIGNLPDRMALLADSLRFGR